MNKSYCKPPAGCNCKPKVVWDFFQYPKPCAEPCEGLHGTPYNSPIKYKQSYPYSKCNPLPPLSPKRDRGSFTQDGGSWPTNLNATARDETWLEDIAHDARTVPTTQVSCLSLWGSLFSPHLICQGALRHKRGSQPHMHPTQAYLVCWS